MNSALSSFTNTGSTTFPEGLGIDDFLFQMSVEDFKRHKKKFMIEEITKTILIHKKTLRRQDLNFATLNKKELFFKITKYLLRFSELMLLSYEEDITVSLASLHASQIFICNSILKKASLFLQDNGNFSIMWAKGEEQAAFEFKGDNKMQYVIFAQRNGYISRSSGDDDIEKIIPLIKLNGLDDLVFE